MNKRWIIGVGMSVCMLLTAGCSNFNTTPHEQEDMTYTIEEKVGAWQGEVVSTSLRPKLETSVDETIYTGNTRSSLFTQAPTEGMQYLLVNVQLEAVSQSGLNLDELEVQIDGKRYPRVQEDRFLKEHNMQPVAHDTVSGGRVEGTLIFEVPQTLKSDAVQDGQLVQEGVQLALSLKDHAEGNIPYAAPITDVQYEKEIQLLDTYKKEEHTLETPFVVVNPYEIAPLTALALFESTEPSQVEVTIKGKSGGKDISYTLDGYNTHHEVPVLWLYGGMANEVVLTATTEDGKVTTSTLQVETEALPSYITDKAIKVTHKEEKMTNGLTLLIDDQRTVVDEEGAVRWYLSVASAASGVEELLDNGHILMPLDAYARWTRFYEMDWLGKVYWAYANADSMNHDATELPNGNILTICGGALVEIERGTGRIIDTTNYEDYFKNEGSLEVRTKGDWDWFHENAVVYNDGDLIISARNQHMVVKLDYKTKKIEWILGSNSAYQSKQADKYLQPIGEDFEWFYSQHQPSILPDLDNNPDTMDLLLFDNGAHRSYEEETSVAPEDMYSRIVHYRIDEKAHTVEQIWQAGKELGLPYYSDIHSGAQYLEATGNYLGAFDASASHDMATWTDYFSTPEHDYPSKIVEFNKEGEILHEIEVATSIYRGYRLDVQGITKGFSNLGEVKGSYTIPEEVAPKKVAKKGAKEGVVSDIIKLTYNQEHLDIMGWAYVEGLETEPANYYLNLVNDEEKYTYPLGRDNRINIPQDKLVEGMEGDVTKGFKEPYLSLEGVEEGMYKLELLVEVKGDVYVQPLDYYFTVNNQSGRIVPVTNRLVEQAQLEKRIQTTFENGNYTADEPLVIQDPYKLSPLTALVVFASDAPMKVSVEVAGKDEATYVTYDFETYETMHTVPIYGLYADTVNDVTLKMTSEDGNTTTKELKLTTQPLPEDFMTIDMKVKKADDYQEGMTFVTSTYLAAIDQNGDARWYINDKGMGGGATPIRRLQNGNLAVMSDRNVAPMYYQTGVYELDLLGKVYNEYVIQGSHHEIQEMPNGNLIVAAEKGSETTEDYVVELDRATGKVVRSWDLGEILGMEKIADKTYQAVNVSDKAMNMEGATEEAIQEAADHTSKHDWLHNNAVDYVDGEDALIISSRHQDMVFKIDGESGEIRWILSDPNDDFPPHLQEKLLKPVGKDFGYPYGQHAVVQLPDGDLMLYDNGNFRSKDVETARAANDSYSRAVRYHIDEANRTIEEVWSYGEKRGKELFTPYIGDIDYFEEGHYLINFGGIIHDSKGNRYNSPVALFTQDDNRGMAKVVEIKDDKIVSELTLEGPKNANTYRVERMPLYAEETAYTPLGTEANRKGSLHASESVKVTLPKEGVFPHRLTKVIDEGDRILVEANFYGVDSETKGYVVLQSNKQVYAYPMTEDASTYSATINKEGMQTGYYAVGILRNQEGKVDYAISNQVIVVE